MKKNIIFNSLFILALLCLVNMSWAGENLINNPDFETPWEPADLDPGSSAPLDPNGWNQWWYSETIEDNAEIGDHTAVYGQLTPNEDASLTWNDNGFVQDVNVIDGDAILGGGKVYLFGGQIVNASGYPLDLGREVLIKAEMMNPEGALSWAQELYIDETADLDVWQNAWPRNPGANIISLIYAPVDYIRIALFMYDQNGWGTGYGGGYYDNIYMIEMEPADLGGIGTGTTPSGGVAPNGRDGWVDILDLGLFVAEFTRNDCDSSNENCNGADLDLDGDVDLVDFSYFAVQWQACLWETCL